MQRELETRLKRSMGVLANSNVCNGEVNMISTSEKPTDGRVGSKGIRNVLGAMLRTHFKPNQACASEIHTVWFKMC